MLLIALFASAYMGILQEQTYAKFGKHPDESVFFNVSCISFILLLILFPNFYFLFSPFASNFRIFSIKISCVAFPFAPAVRSSL